MYVGLVPHMTCSCETQASMGVHLSGGSNLGGLAEQGTWLTRESCLAGDLVQQGAQNEQGV